MTSYIPWRCYLYIIFSTSVAANFYFCIINMVLHHTNYSWNLVFLKAFYHIGDIWHKAWSSTSREWLTTLSWRSQNLKLWLQWYANIHCTPQITSKIICNTLAHLILSSKWKRCFGCDKFVLSRGRERQSSICFTQDQLRKWLI